MGNIRSIQKAFERIRIKVEICEEPDKLLYAAKIVLPGIGHFKKGIYNLKELGFYDILNEAVINKKVPILGICLGMQLMTSYSEEGDCEGFGWIDGDTRKYKFENKKLKIPHMGWNNLQIKKDSKLLDGIIDNDFFYFVHSYYIECKNKDDVLATANYGKDFVSVFNKDNIFGCQFHPEKSHDAGLKVMKNFTNI